MDQFLNQKYFKYTYGLRMIKENEFKGLFGFSSRKEKKKLLKHTVIGSCNTKSYRRNRD